MLKKILIVLALVIVLSVAVVGFNIIGSKESPVVTTTPINVDEKVSEAGADMSNKGWSSFASLQGISFKYPADSVKVFDDQEENYIYLTGDFSDSLVSLRGKTREAVAIGEKGSALEGHKQEKFSFGWNIAVKEVKDEAELDAFIKSHYGAGCKMDSKELRAEDGAYEVSLNEFKDAEGADVGLDGAVCSVNYSYKLLYAPEIGKAFSLVLGQECTFTADSELADCFDGDITDSIRID